MWAFKSRQTRNALLKARSVTSPFDVAITGAGISRDAPSALPGAEDLAVEVWNAIRKSLGSHITDMLDRKIRARLPEVWMEQVLELLSGPGAVPVSIIVNVYRLVGGALFNENHLRLAALDVEHFTLNMDTLIDEAGVGVRITHLHGQWDTPRSIRTTVTHYSMGLAPALKRRFGRALKGANVLVIGYSGRDSDVLPMFTSHPPKRITWVGPNPDQWIDEVKTLRQTFDSDPNRHFTPVDKRAGDYLPGIVPVVPSLTPRVSMSFPTDLLDDLERRTSVAQRLNATAQLMLGMGLNHEITQLLGRHEFAGPVEVQRRKILARAHDRLGNPARALQLLLTRPNRLSEVGPWLTNLNEVAAVAPRASRPALRHRLQPIVVVAGYMFPTRRMRRRRMLAQVRIAKSRASRGRLMSAIALTRKVTSSHRAQYVMGDAGFVDALTWLADALKSQGSLNDARATARRAVRLVEYSLPSQRAYAVWKLGEIEAVAGPQDGESPSAHRDKVGQLFEEAQRYAELAGANDTLAWIHGTRAEFAIGFDIAEAEYHIAEAESRRRADPGRGPTARAYVQLQRSAVDIFAGRLTSAQKRLERLIADLDEREAPAVHLQGHEILAELLWRQDPNYDLAREYTQIANKFQTLEMELSAARLRVAVASIQGVPVDGRLQTLAKNKGWSDLAAKMAGSSGSYPWTRGLLL